MKIFNNAVGSGFSGSGDNVSPGDIVLSVVNKTYDETQPNNISNKWVNISQESFLSEFEDTDIPTITNSTGIAAQLVTYKKAQAFSGLNQAQITRLDNDRYLYTGSSGDNNEFYIVGIAKNGESQYKLSIDIENANFYSSVYDYNNTVYIYRNSQMSLDDLFTNEIYKVNLTTLEYDKVTINNKRICKAYYSRSLNKYITHEFNNLNMEDQESKSSGIFVSDDFENTSTVATFEALSNNNDFKNQEITKSIHNIGSKMLYTTDNNFLIYHDTEKQLKKYVSGVSSIVIDVLDKNLAKTLVVSQSLIVEYDNNYFLCYNHKIDEASNYKTWVRRKTDLTGTAEYCFCQDLNIFENNNGYIVKDVFNRDFAHPTQLFGYAIVYQNFPDQPRKCTTFRNNYTYADINTINDVDRQWMLKNYYIDINYTAMFNNEKQYIIDNFGTLSSFQIYEGNISSFAFNGLGVPGVYVQKMDGTQTSKYFLRVRK